MRISILCPTRNRPNNIIRMVTSALWTANKPRDIEFVFYVDNDDRTSEESFRVLREREKAKIEVVAGGRIVLSQMWNECYRKACGPIYMHAGDDIEFMTQDWDQIVRAEFDKYADRIAFVYGSDGIMPNTFGTHGFIHKNWAETVGYFVPPYFSSDYNDTWLNDVAKMIDRHIFIPIHTEHYHPTVGKAEWDATHLERVERHKRDGVEAIYANKLGERENDARRLREFIDNYGQKIPQTN